MVLNTSVKQFDSASRQDATMFYSEEFFTLSVLNSCTHYSVNFNTILSKINTEKLTQAIV